MKKLYVNPTTKELVYDNGANIISMPKGSLRTTRLKNDTVLMLNAKDNYFTFMAPEKVTDLHTSDGTPYTSMSEMLTALKDFFFDVSTGSGQLNLQITEDTTFTNSEFGYLLYSDSANIFEITVPEQTILNADANSIFAVVQKGSAVLRVALWNGTSYDGYETTGVGKGFSVLNLGSNDWLVSGSYATYTVVTVTQLAPNNNAASTVNELDEITGFSSSTNSIDITSVASDGESTYMIRGVANQVTTFARIGVSFEVENGVVYDLSWQGKEGAGADARLYLFENVTGTITSMTTTRATYNTTVTATTTGTATIQWVLVNSQIGHEIFIDQLSITAQ